LNLKLNVTHAKFKVFVPEKFVAKWFYITADGAVKIVKNIFDAKTIQ